MNKELLKSILGCQTESIRLLVFKLGFSKNATSSRDKNLKLSIPFHVVHLLFKNQIYTVLKSILGIES